MELCHIDSYETNRESEYVIELELPVSSHLFCKTVITLSQLSSTNLPITGSYIFPKFFSIS